MRTIIKILLLFLGCSIAGCGITPNGYVPDVVELPALTLGTLGPGDEPPTPSTSDYVVRSAAQETYKGISD